jgi:hypothetical protein
MADSLAGRFFIGRSRMDMSDLARSDRLSR